MADSNKKLSQKKFQKDAPYVAEGGEVSKAGKKKVPKENTKGGNKTSKKKNGLEAVGETSGKVPVQKVAASVEPLFNKVNPEAQDSAASESKPKKKVKARSKSRASKKIVGGSVPTAAGSSKKTIKK